MSLGQSDKFCLIVVAGATRSASLVRSPIELPKIVKFTRNRIFGIIGTVWGGAVVISALFRVLSDNAAYAAGQIGGFILGALLFCVGLYYAIKG